MTTLQEGLTVFPTLFPEVKGPSETQASPEIWKNIYDFKAHAAKLVSDAKAAEAAVPNGQEAFMLAVQEVSKDCAACHDKYTKH